MRTMMMMKIQPLKLEGGRYKEEITSGRAVKA